MGKKILSQIKYWGQIFLIPFYFISYLMPRKKNIWVFGSTFGRRFADNPKYFYLYLSQYQTDNVRPIWISKSKEIIHLLNSNSLEAYYLYSMKGIWFSLRAKVYLYDNYSKDICFTLSGGATKINMWHGIPLKKIQKDNIFDRVRNPETKIEKWRWALRRMSDEKPSDYVLTTSESLKPIFSSAFQTRNVLVCGYPRNEILLSESIRNVLSDQENRDLLFLNEKALNNKIVLYMPTFRESETKFFDIISIDKFEKFLEKEQIIFCVKLHQKSKLQERFNRINHNNIFIIDAQADPYPFLKISDKLITDYSSIYFDFLLTGKPIIFFSYDLNEYLNDSREMYFDYEKFTPGVKVKNQEELETTLRFNTNENEMSKEILYKIYDRMNHDASINLYNKILDIIN